jgi:hypothetical protein
MIQVIEHGFITEDEAKGRLTPTESACCLKFVWDFGAIVLKHFAPETKDVIESLVEKSVLRYHDGLFTPDEARYLNYMLNDSEATNSLSLRNKYSHANAPVTDPNTNEMRNDYHTMLALLVSITLKINEEFMDATGKGGLDPDGLVGWPLYDESVYETAKAMAGRKHR